VKLLLTTLNAKYIHSSLALRYLKAYCQRDFPDIVVKEFTINNGILEILGNIYRETPTIVGFACYIWNIEMTLSLVKMLKKVAPTVTVILGGPEVSYDPVEVLEENPGVDFVVSGEGEETLRQLLMALHGPRDFQAIKGLGYRNPAGEPVFNGPPQIMANLDAIPFPYTTADIEDLADKIIYYESSRGCPFNCQYCLSSTTKGVRYFSLERVRQDLQVLIDHNVKQVKFVDRTFNANKAHYLPILEFLAVQECRTNFHFEIAVDLLTDEVIDFLQQVPKGRFQFEIGIQSTHEPTLAAIKRHNNWPRIVHNMERLRSAGNIHLHLDLIVGLPYEDFARFGQSFNDVYALKPHMLQIGFLKLLKGSGIRRQAAEHQYLFMDNAPYEVLQNKYLPYAAISQLKSFETVFEQVYNNGLFNYTLPLAISQHGGNPFHFYNDFTNYWLRHNLLSVAHSPKSIFKYLYQFCESFLTEEQLAVCQEFLKFDALMVERGNMRPEFLPWNDESWQQQVSAFWRNERLVARYLPGFKFHTWRQVRKYYHIEVFAVDVPHYHQTGQIVEKPTPVLFRYDQGIPRFTVIDAADFWGATDAL